MYIHILSGLDCFDREMWPPKQPNAAPSESEASALMKLLERQESLVSSIESLRKETDVEHQRLSCKATMLHDTLKHMEHLNSMRRRMQSECYPWLDGLSKLLLDMEAKRDFLQPLFDGTSTVLDGFSAINDAIDLLKLKIKTAFDQLPDFFAIVAREFYSTDMLRAQTASAIASFSDYGQCCSAEHRTPAEWCSSPSSPAT
jgi:hypothetical protein